VRNHELFQRHGADLHCEVPVPFELATLGGEVQVPTIDGYAKLKLAAGTENGKTFRLRGRGMPDIDGYGRGAMHVRVVIEVPSRLGSAQKKLVKAAAESLKPSNYPLRAALEAKAEAFFERKEAIKREAK
jgi:molecular chaperone DnaJ